MAGTCVARASGRILTGPGMASRVVGVVPDSTRPRWAARWWPRGPASGCPGAAFRSLSGAPRGLRPRGAANGGRPPRVPQECDCDEPQHGRDGVRRRRPRAPWGACRPAPGPGPRARGAVGISQGVPGTGGPDAPRPSGRGNAGDLSLLACAPGRAGQGPGARMPVRRRALAGRGAGQRASCRGAGGEVASFPRRSRLAAATQWVSDAAGARVLVPAPSEGPCLAWRMASARKVRWAVGRAFPDPCLGRARPVGAQGAGDLPGRPEAAHVDRAAEGVHVASGAGPTKAAGRGHSRALGGKGPRVPSGAQPALGGSWEPLAKSCAA